MLYETDGVVLSQTALGEYDKIIAVFTQTQGVVKAVVKGARKAASKLSSITQPFCEATFQFYKGRSLDRVTQVGLKSSHSAVVGQYEKTVYASYLAELILELLPERQPQEEQYRFFIQVLACMETRDDSWIVTKWAEIGFLQGAGLAPSLKDCVQCGAPIEETVGKETEVLFSVANGGVICRDCLSQTDDGFQGNILISLGALKTMQMLHDSVVAGGRACPNIAARGRVRSQIDSVLRRYMEYALGKRLKSTSLVESIEAGQK